MIVSRIANFFESAAFGAAWAIAPVTGRESNRAAMAVVMAGSFTSSVVGFKGFEVICGRRY